MRRFGNWAVAMATLMMLGSVGMKALTEPGPGATRVAPAAAAPAAAPAQTATPQAPASGYVGAETCVGCHTGYDGTVNATKHGFRANARTPMATQGCESCHGPGEAHASDPEKVKPVQFDKANTRSGTAASTRTAT
jgi:Cytochrome c554 and c-prime